MNPGKLTSDPKRGPGPTLPGEDETPVQEPEPEEPGKIAPPDPGRRPK